jgi:hypothetical protein
MGALEMTSLLKLGAVAASRGVYETPRIVRTGRDVPDFGNHTSRWHAAGRVASGVGKFGAAWRHHFAAMSLSTGQAGPEQNLVGLGTLGAAVADRLEFLPQLQLLPLPPTRRRYVSAGDEGPLPPSVS